MKPGTLSDYRTRTLRVLVHIQENLDRQISLGEIAGVAGFSPYHFHRIFRGMVGESLAAHVRRIRLERAAHELRFSRRPVTQLAFEAGFSSHEAFTRAFRNMTGMSPSAYRSQQHPSSLPAAASHVHYSAGHRPRRFDPVDEGGSTMDVRIVHRDPVRVAFARHIGPYDRVGETWERFMTVVGAEGLLGPGAEILGMCHDDPEVTPPAHLRYDACVSIADAVEPGHGIGVQTIGGGDYALTTHEGPYRRLEETYAKLYGQWIPRSGRRVRAAPCLESYLNDPENTDPEELLTDILAPLEPV